LEDLVNIGVGEWFQSIWPIAVDPAALGGRPDAAVPTDLLSRRTLNGRGMYTPPTL
jgi:hypothetical protein